MKQRGSKISESTLKKRVMRDLRSLPYIWVLKTQERSVLGIPDLIICVKGRFVSIELKRSGEKPEPIQIARINEIRRAGGLAIWSDPDRWPFQFDLLKRFFALLSCDVRLDIPEHW